MRIRKKKIIKQSRKMGPKARSEALHHFLVLAKEQRKPRVASNTRGRAREGGAMTWEEGKAIQGEDE